MYDLIKNKTMYLIKECIVQDKEDKLRLQSIINQTMFEAVKSKEDIEKTVLDKLNYYLSNCDSIKRINTNQVLNKDRVSCDVIKVAKLTIKPLVRVYEGTTLTRINVLKKEGYKLYKLELFDNDIRMSGKDIYVKTEDTRMNNLDGGGYKTLRKNIIYTSGGSIYHRATKNVLRRYVKGSVLTTSVEYKGKIKASHSYQVLITSNFLPSDIN